MRCNYMAGLCNEIKDEKVKTFENKIDWISTKNCEIEIIKRNKTNKNKESNKQQQQQKLDSSKSRSLKKQKSKQLNISLH